MAEQSRSSTNGDNDHVVGFEPRAKVNARTAFENFISKWRRLNPINVDEWDSARWDFPKTSRQSSASEGGLVFSVRSANTPDPGEFPEPFMSFVKAVICAYNSRAARPYAVGQSQTLIAAARLLFDELKDRGGDPLDLKHGDFDAAANRAQANMGQGASNIGSKLAIISDEIDRAGVTAVPIRWKNRIKRDHKHDRVGAKATARRHEMLPEASALDALSEISSSEGLDDRDLVIQRAIDLLLCGGFRINEVLTLPRDTLVEEPLYDESGEPLLDKFGRPANRVGLRYWPEKGGHTVSQIKWVPTVLVDLAMRAIADLQRITKPYHDIAVHQRDHPRSTILGEPWDLKPPEELISLVQVAQVMGLTEKNPGAAGSQFVKGAGIEIFSELVGNRRIQCVQIGDVRNCTWERSKKGNVLNGEVGNLDISEALFTIPLFFVKRTLQAGLCGTVQLLSDAMVQVYLVSQANGNQPSIFERLGYLDEAGRPLRLNSHQFRHLLNTLAAEGSLSEIEIARWMGRSKVTQNAAYQHVTPVARAEGLRNRLRLGEATGPIADRVLAIQDPIRREEFIASTTATAHVTDLGICVHPWDSFPCAEHGACEECPQHRIIKGDQSSRDRAVANLEQTESIINIAKAEADDDTWGADNWLAAHQSSANAFKRIIAVHDDATLPDGTVVQLPQETLRKFGNDDA